MKVSRLPSLTVLLPIAASTGATLTSLTVIVKVSKSVSAGRAVVGDRDGDVVRARPWASVGVQLKTPVVASIVSPGQERPRRGCRSACWPAGRHPSPWP